MKKIKTLLITVLISSIVSVSYAQTFGVSGGLNFSKMSIKDNFGTADSKMIVGYHLGVSTEFPFDKKFSFETGLFLSTKGTKRTEISPLGHEYDTEYKANLTYLDIPLNAKVRIDLKTLKLYGVFGPYLSVGLNGKSYEDGDGTNINWGTDSDNDNLKRLDYGLNIGAGVEVNTIKIGLTYGLGLANISSYTDDGTKVSNQVLSISIGYMFGEKK